MYPVYCDHTHLYSFYYDTVTPLESSDATTDLAVTAGSMIGFPGACIYDANVDIISDVAEDTIVATTGDRAAWTCGYYTTYQWNGNGDLFFIIHTANAILNTCSLLTLVTLTNALIWKTD